MANDQQSSMATQTAILVTIGVVVCASILGAVLSPSSTPAVIGFGTLIAVSLLSLAAQIKNVAKTEEAGAKLEEIAETTKRTEATGTVTHSLVNSAFGNVLKTASVALRRVAELTKHPEDEKAADLADVALAEHLAKQAKVDAAIKKEP